MNLILGLLLLQAQPIEWSKNLEDAKKAAGGTKPIAIFLVQKSCPLSGEFLRNLSKDDRTPELAAGITWLMVQVGTDEYRSWFVKTCGANVQGTPSLLFLNPKGDNADPAYAGLDTVTSTDPDDIIPVLREVVQRSKKEMPEKDKTKVKDAAAKAKAATAPGDAIGAWRSVIRAGDGWRPEEKTVEEARAEIEKLLQGGCAEMLKIQATVRQPSDALKAFEEVKGRYAGTSIADWAADEIARLKKAGVK